MSDKTTQFGVNLNNREPLIAPDYDLQALLDLSTIVEDSGFDSVWVGDSLFSKPRYEPLALLAAISQRTSRWSGRRSTCSPAAAPSSASARATRRRAFAASSPPSGSTTRRPDRSGKRASMFCGR